MLTEKMTIRMGGNAKKKLEELAEKDGRDTSNFCRFLLESFALIQNPAQIAIVQILKEGKDLRTAEKYLDLIVKEGKTHIELDKVAIQKIRDILGGNE